MVRDFGLAGVFAVLRDCRAGVVAETDADGWLQDVLAAALEANERLARLAEGLTAENARLREENARLRERDALREAELERLRAELAVLQRLVFGRSSERARPAAARGEDGGARAGTWRAAGRQAAGARGAGGAPGLLASAPGRGDLGFSWRQVLLPAVRGAVHPAGRSRRGAAGLGSEGTGARALPPPVPAGLPVPGPGGGDGARPAEGDRQGPFVQRVHRAAAHRAVRGRPQPELAGHRPGPAWRGHLAGDRDGNLRGRRDAAGPAGGGDHRGSRGTPGICTPTRPAGTSSPRTRETARRSVAMGVIGPDTTCFVMAAARAGAVLARHAGIDEETGQLADDGDGPRRLVISSDFCSVCTSAGKKADGLVNLCCWAHIRRYFVRAGDASPAQLTYWTAAWLGRIKALYTAHEKLTAAWAIAAAPAPPQAAEAAARLEEARAAWDGAIGAIDEARKQQMAAPACRSPPRRRSPRWTGNGTG